LFEHEKLGKLIGIPIVPTIGSSGFGIDTLFEKAIEVYEDRDSTVRHIHIHYGHELEKALRKLQAQLRTENNLQTLISSRYLAINLLQDRKRTLTLLETNPNLNGVLAELDRQKARLKELFEETTDQLVTDAKYGFIAGALKETYTANELDKLQTTKIIDTVLTHKFWGFPIFFGFMWFMFQVTFSLGSYPMDWLDAVVGFVAEGFGTYMPDGVLKDLIVDGIIGGVGGVIVFLPNILLLFFFISLMEDTGYMARAAFIMDRVMHKFGLHGKSFIPLIMGFGCNVPAVMASRTLENKNERLLTMLINPFMSCSARLPVYVLIVAAVFPKNAGTVLFSIYILGIVLAAMVAMLFSKTLFRNTEAPFVMELPPYRIPTLKSTVRHMWHKAAQYLQKMGGVILIASILIWAMSYYPRSSENTASYTAEYTQVSSTYTQQEKLLSGAPLDTLLLHKEAALAELQLKIDADRQQNSYIGQMGKTLSPLLAPLGFDWKMTVSIITGMAAKEIVVSTMGVLYQADENADENSQTLITKIKHNKFDTGVYKGENTFTPVRAYAFMVFVLIYFPCIAVIAAVRKESGSGKWALFLAVYTTVLAWVLAFIINYLGKFF
jgi:ferrous iron transport protein B